MCLLGLLLAACSDDSGTPALVGDAAVEMGGGVDSAAAADSAGSFPLVCSGSNGSATHGTTIPQGETCCTCSAPGTSAPTFSCTPRVTTVKCNYNGKLYDDGQVFPSDDGCNSCMCNPSGCMPGRWGCSLRLCTDGGPSPDAPPADAPSGMDKQRPDDGPLPDFLRAEHGAACPLDPPAPGSSCTLDPNLGCDYRPICASGTPVNQSCACTGGQWTCDQGGYCARP